MKYVVAAIPIPLKKKSKRIKIVIILGWLESDLGKGILFIAR